MKDVGALVNLTAKKVSAKRKLREVQTLELPVSDAGVGTSTPVVDLDEDPVLEEPALDSTKKQKLGTPSKRTEPIPAVPVRSEKGDFFQLPKVWSDHIQCGPDSTIFLDDSELRIIQDLGPAGRNKAMAEGVIATMKALEVAAALNNVALEHEVRVDALAKERDALSAKELALKEGQRSQRSVAEERDHRLASLEAQLVEAKSALENVAAYSHELAE
jgi:hypothetical protein